MYRGLGVFWYNTVFDKFSMYCIHFKVLEYLLGDLLFERTFHVREFISCVDGIRMHLGDFLHFVS